jgi:spermidine synthase
LSNALIQNEPAKQPIPPTTSIAGPCAIAFIASASVMIVELIAFRLVARYLGNSNYTVTSIIGVILGGLALGNFVGGRIADRFHLGRALSILFVLCSAGCFAVPMLNKAVGEWSALWFLSWPQRIALHVTLTYALPAILLGTIGPIVAKMALLRNTHIGRTVGLVYAFGALGSIVGTFACGFYLIPQFGNYAVIQSVAALLAIMAIISAGAYWFSLAWAATTIMLLGVGLGQWPWAQSWGAELGVRERLTPDVLFDADSQYSHVRVERSHDHPSKRTLVLDKLEHSYFDVDKPDALLYGYERIFAAVTDCIAGPRDGIRALILGGGGYTHPRYILRRRPNSYVEVAEIDPVVTRAAMEAFGLTPDSRMKIVHLDARQHLADLIHRKGSNDKLEKFDFVFVDALNDFSIPFHLTTREFYDMIASVMSDEGVVMVNLIDVYDVGNFLGATINTLRQTFQNVECFYAGAGDEKLKRNERITFVAVASNRDLTLKDLEKAPAGAAVADHRLSHAQFDDLVTRSGGLVLTDDHAPVESLLAAVVRHGGKDILWKEAATKFYIRGNSEAALRQFNRAATSCREAIKVEPKMSIAWLNLGIALVELKNWREAETAFNEAARLEPDSAGATMNLAGLYMLTKNYDLAERFYRSAVKLEPSNVHALNGLGRALGNLGRLGESKEAFESALRVDSDFAPARENLARVSAAMQAQSQPAGP